MTHQEILDYIKEEFSNLYSNPLNCIVDNAVYDETIEYDSEKGFITKEVIVEIKDNYYRFLINNWSTQGYSIAYGGEAKQVYPHQVTKTIFKDKP